ncbi:glycosyltransferase family A protein [Thioclava electrotropha]|uniref:Glycosyltransferase family 2 protein n=1 Tax=Thioclava electrotropha TaxID=1549850 RepID=A0ABX6YWL6_9RHOB|nr:glycosyltransferase family A protein [Thioclava electrotropha]QPZ92241.1 glycosyltransferase family 2 protein [Thioclava electrotropha]
MQFIWADAGATDKKPAHLICEPATESSCARAVLLGWGSPPTVFRSDTQERGPARACLQESVFRLWQETMASQSRPLAEQLPRDDASPRYAALIRAYECPPLLAEVIAKLREQSFPPEDIIIVDSSHEEQVRDQFAALGATVVPYDDTEFNYSKAINVGVEANTLPYTLIFSSHVVFDDPKFVENGWREMKARDLEIVYWAPAHSECPDPSKLEPVSITPRLFNGRNGISNSAALTPTALMRERPFREEVFSAEDQEWTRYYLKRFKRPVLRIESEKFRYLNPNHGETVWSQAKLLNEELAIGHFVNRRLVMPDRIAARFLRGVLATIRRRPDRARMHFAIAKALLAANFKPPKRQSRYF